MIYLLVMTLCGTVRGVMPDVTGNEKVAGPVSGRMVEKMSGKRENATFAAGCFWCVEAIFKELQGVEQVVSGYAGGTVDNPTYQDVCGGTTGHAEAIQITFDPDVISFEDLLFVFWNVHDPTTVNRQGSDVGTQYRSAIFYHGLTQKGIAEKSKEETGASGLWLDPLVTEITPFANFFAAEAYHQDFYKDHPDQPYCRLVIEPKIKKFRKEFHKRLQHVSRR